MGITVVGAGLAGCEAAYQISRFGIKVRLIDMKPVEKSPAHHSDNYAELVCSNSLKSDSIENACGLLKEEMRIIGSLSLEAADMCRIPAGGALAVDRDVFAKYITDKILDNPYIDVVVSKVDTIPQDDCVIIATGPLTSGNLYTSIKEKLGNNEMFFYDAAAPIIDFDSIDMSKSFCQSRYQKGGDDYINCPLTEQEYKVFVNELINAQKAAIREFEDLKVFEGCMPVEVIASRGEDTLRFGPMKPVGLIDPSTGLRPYACVQLRQDNLSGSLYSPVGFQTRLTFSEQERVFRLIPGLVDARFARHGVMHRNTYINSPGIIDNTFMSIKFPGLYFAGQITGVEGYVESMASGITAGINAALMLSGSSERFIPPVTTIIGALADYISNSSISGFQPMNANFGILPVIASQHKVGKKEKNILLAKRSLDAIEKTAKYLKFSMT